VRSGAGQLQWIGPLGIRFARRRWGDQLFHRRLHEPLQQWQREPESGRALDGCSRCIPFAVPAVARRLPLP